MAQEEQGMHKDFHQPKYFSSKRTGARTQKIIRLGAHQRMSTTNSS